MELEAGADSNISAAALESLQSQFENQIPHWQMAYEAHLAPLIQQALDTTNKTWDDIDIEKDMDDVIAADKEQGMLILLFGRFAHVPSIRFSKPVVFGSSPVPTVSQTQGACCKRLCSFNRV